MLNDIAPVTSELQNRFILHDMRQKLAAGWALSDESGPND